MLDFRSRLIATLKAVGPVLSEPGVLVVGSEVPNLLETGAASTLVVSEDVDIGVPIEAHARVKARLAEIRMLKRSPDEPSVWLPLAPELIEVNFVGIDRSIRDASETYVLNDPELPLLVFGALSFLRPGRRIEVDGQLIPLPRCAGLLLEKLVTDRTRSQLEKRAKAIRARALVRAWEYRQRNHAKGVWFRLRRVLTDASAAYAITEDTALRLISSGVSPLRVGR